MSLEEKIVVVTGATGALGRVVAKMFLDEGAHVVSMYRSEQKLKELEDFLGETRENLTSVQADSLDEVSLQSLFQKVIQQHGRVDILLNIVGGYKGGADIADTTVSDWDYMMDLNLKSVFLCSKAALPYMMKQNYGKIVNVASRTAVEKRYRSRSGAYAVSKAGVIVLTETIAEEVRKYNINVNCVMPSTIDTPDNRRNLADADSSKWVKPEQIVKVLLFLSSDDSKTINGACVPVYGKA
jgi:NAD(P)-dependent dehydrogenase (short-subunit alcohol dehydrogenase family)